VNIFEAIQFATSVIFTDDSDDEFPFSASPAGNYSAEECNAGIITYYQITNGSGVTWEVDETGIPIEGFDAEGDPIPWPGRSIDLYLVNIGTEEIPDGNYPLHAVLLMKLPQKKVILTKGCTVVLAKVSVPVDEIEGTKGAIVTRGVVKESFFKCLVRAVAIEGESPYPNINGGYDLDGKTRMDDGHEYQLYLVNGDQLIPVDITV